MRSAWRQRPGMVAHDAGSLRQQSAELHAGVAVVPVIQPKHEWKTLKTEPSHVHLDSNVTT